MRSHIRVQVHGEITPKVDKDQSATKEHPWGLKCKDWTSCEKIPYLGREDDVAKMMQLKESKCKMAREPTWRKGQPNWAEVSLGRSAQASQPGQFQRRFGPLFLRVKMMQPEVCVGAAIRGESHSSKRLSTREKGWRRERSFARWINRVQGSDYKCRRMSRPCHNTPRGQGRQHRKRHHDQWCHA
jgi:hypothetical protein